MTRISMADLARPGLTESQKWLMMLRHFLDCPYGERAIGEEVLNAMYTNYKKAQRRESELNKVKQLAAEVDGDAPPLPDQLSTDLSILQRYLHLADGELRFIHQDKTGLVLDAAGQVAYGAQSRIAEMLDITNAGATNRDRILAVLGELQAMWSDDQQKEQAA